MIRDRGRIKWTSMMLPEHVKLLRDWAEADSYEKEKEMDEQKLEEMNHLLLAAMEEHQSVMVTHYRYRKHELIIGQIHYWDELQQRLHIVDHFGEVHRVPLSSIVDVQMKE